MCVLKDDLFLGIVVVFGKMLMELESEQFPNNTAADDIFTILMCDSRDSANALPFCEVYEHFINILVAVNGCSTNFPHVLISIC